MPAWSKVTQPEGVYISETFNISNTLDRYVAAINVTDINTYNQTLDFYYSVSYDGAQWESWKPFQMGATDLFDDYNLTNLYFRYKVVIASTDDTQKPYLQEVSFLLQPFASLLNEGDLTMKPKVWIRKINGRGDIQLVNHMTGQKVELTDVQNGEEIYIDFENEEIISSLQYLGVYRFDNHNDEWLELIRGENYLKGYGDFEIDFRFQNILLQE